MSDHERTVIRESGGVCLRSLTAVTLCNVHLGPCGNTGFWNGPIPSSASKNGVVFLNNPTGFCYSHLFITQTLALCFN